MLWGGKLGDRPSEIPDRLISNCSRVVLTDFGLQDDDLIVVMIDVDRVDTPIRRAVAEWAVVSREGILTGAGQTMMLERMAETDTLTMVMRDDRLMGSSAMVTAAYELEYFQGPDWPLILDPASPLSLLSVLNPANAAIVANCGVNNLLRVTATNTVRDPGSGILVDFRVRLFVVHTNLLFGTTEGDIGPMNAKRILVMRR